MFKFTNKDYEVMSRLQRREKNMFHTVNPDVFQHLNAAVAVWCTRDFHGAKDLLYRWWNHEVLDCQDLLNFVEMRRNTSVCLSDPEICELEKKILDEIETVAKSFFDEEKEKISNKELTHV